MMDTTVYYKWQHNTEGTTLVSSGHIASPAPVNERWSITEIDHAEYEQITQKRSCLECDTFFIPKTEKTKFCCNRCFMKFYSI